MSGSPCRVFVRDNVISSLPKRNTLRIFGDGVWPLCGIPRGSTQQILSLTWSLEGPRRFVQGMQMLKKLLGRGDMRTFDFPPLADRRSPDQKEKPPQRGFFILAGPKGLEPSTFRLWRTGAHLTKTRNPLNGGSSFLRGRRDSNSRLSASGGQALT